MWRRTGVLGSVLVLCLVLCCTSDLPRFNRPEKAPAEVELAAGWTLATARDVPGGGAAVSTRDFDDSAWHRIPTMPATVLEALRADGTYPDPY